MNNLQLPDQVYATDGNIVLFNQLAVKIELDRVSNADYYGWLDQMADKIGSLVPGAQIAEKPNARTSPPLNTAVYYDTQKYDLLPTGALLRTSCNRITHAFCAFKMAQDQHSVRNDHRYVFAGEEKSTIQEAPASEKAIAIVKRLLARKDIVHPGTYLEHTLGIRGEDVEPVICLDDLRFTFFVWLDGRDALRCSLDRYDVSDLHIADKEREKKAISEVELAVYPRIDQEVARSPRVVEMIGVLSDSLCSEFGVCVTSDIKYQRAARALGLYKG